MFIHWSVSPQSAASSSLCLVLPVGNNNKLTRGCHGQACVNKLWCENWKKKRKQQQQLIIIINNNKCDETLAEARVKDSVRATRDECFFFFVSRDGNWLSLARMKFSTGFVRHLSNSSISDEAQQQELSENSRNSNRSRGRSRTWTLSGTYSLHTACSCFVYRVTYTYWR